MLFLHKFVLMLFLSPLMLVLKKKLWMKYGDFSTWSKYILRDGDLMDKRLQQQQQQQKYLSRDAY